MTPLTASLQPPPLGAEDKDKPQRSKSFLVHKREPFRSFRREAPFYMARRDGIDANA